MHGLVIRSFESFMRNTYGDSAWEAAVQTLDAGIDEFEPMFHYESDVATGLVSVCARQLGKPREALLEDWGIFLVAHPASERVRRLLRFGGVDFEDFVASLEDLSGRARLAVSDLVLPDLVVTELGEAQYEIGVRAQCPDFVHVFIGLLRTVADDYGALVLIEHEQRVDGDAVTLQLLASDFADGRGFELAQFASG